MFVASAGAEMLASVIVGSDSANYETVTILITYLIIYPVLVPLLILLMKFFSRKDGGFKVSDSIRRPKMPAGWIAKWILIMVGMTYVLSFVSNIIFILVEMLIQTFTDFELNPATLIPEDNLFNKLVLFFSIVILAPIFEELLFRATNYRNAMKYGAWSMIIISGITFGLWHMNYIQTLYTAFFGVFSCFMYSKTRSIIPSVIAHMSLNLISGIEILLIDYDAVLRFSEGKASLFDVLDSIMIAAVIGVFIIGLAITGLVLFIIEVVKHRRSFVVENSLPDVPESKKTLTYLTAPVTVIMFLLLGGLTVFNAISG